MNAATIYRNYDRAEAPDMTVEDWTPTIRAELSDAEVEAWIAEFAETGDICDEFGGYKSHRGTTPHACALQWVIDPSALGQIVGPVFWRFSRACAQLAMFGKCEARD